MNYALIFAGGVGRRMNTKARPKQFLEIHGKPILIHTIEYFENHPDIDAICVVIVDEWIDYTRNLLEKFNISKVKWLVSGGDSALGSQYNGLCAIINSESNLEDAIVLIHDGVRPLINNETISKCIEGVKDNGSAVTVAPAIETIIKADAENCIVDTFPRSECQLARAPQSFRLCDIIEAHQKRIEDGNLDFVDSTSMMLNYGYKIFTVEGPSENIKVTNPADYYICKALLEVRENSQIFGI